MITACLQIGNSDDKLTQKEWGAFFYETHELVKEMSENIFFTGCSNPTAPWQNACFVFSVKDEHFDTLKEELADILHEFRQDTAALGKQFVEFVKAKEKKEQYEYKQTEN